MPSVEIKPGYSTTAAATNATATIVPLFGAQAGAVGSVWLNFACDFGAVELRVAVRAAGKWIVQSVVVDSSKDWVSVAVPAKATHASVLRVDRGVASAATVPVIAEVIVKGA